MTGCTWCSSVLGEEIVGNAKRHGVMNSNSVNFSVTLGKASGDSARDRCQWRARQYHREREACGAESAFPPFLLNVHWLSFCLFTCWTNVPSSTWVAATSPAV